MHITLTGNLGSGKSTISKIFAEKGYEIYSTGKIQRTLAAERGLTVLEMNKLMETDHSFDNIIDDTTTKLSKEHKEDLFFDSRLAWHFAVNSFKIFLSVDINEAARRVFNDDKRGEVEKYKSVDEAKANLIARAEAEDSRYKELYKINYFDMSNYNLVLDSTYASPDILANIIAKEKSSYEQKIASGIAPEEIRSRILISPARLLDTKPETCHRDDDDIFDTEDVIIKREGSSLALLRGSDIVWRVMKSGYEFISVKEAD
ncbi:MAG: dephospho-CoA kinase [Lachnospiraceae bacterium]|nr:dephospho-CoA kinase [Lachnospiraceae bacterium]